MKAKTIAPLSLAGAGTVATLVATALASSCGGKLAGDTLGGAVNDAGVYQLVDGAVLFSPGSACATYNHDAAPAPFCSPVSWCPSDYATCVADNATCNAWDPKLGLSYPMRRACGRPGMDDFLYDADAGHDLDDGGGVCAAVLDPSQAGGEVTRCHPGPAGDAYCSAFYQQFVLGDGKALAVCSTYWMPSQEFCNPFGKPPCPSSDLVSVCTPACGTLDYALKNGAPAPPSPDGFEGIALVPTVCVKRDHPEGPLPESFCAPPP